MSRRYNHRQATPWHELPAERAALEARLEELRKAKADFDAFTKGLLEVESAVAVVMTQNTQSSDGTIY